MNVNKFPPLDQSPHGPIMRLIHTAIIKAMRGCVERWSFEVLDLPVLMKGDVVAVLRFLQWKKACRSYYVTTYRRPVHVSLQSKPSDTFILVSISLDFYNGRSKMMDLCAYKDGSVGKMK